MISKSYTFRSNYIGPGYISGKVMQNLTPIAGARLILYHANYPLETTYSDISGNYRFDNLSLLHEFDVLARDPSGVWESKISTRRKAGV